MKKIQQWMITMAVGGLLGGYTSQAEEITGFHKVLTLNEVSFDIRCEEKSSLNTAFIKPSGLKDNKMIQEEVDGRIVDAYMADLNQDGSPELYIFTTSAGSGSVGSLLAYSTNNQTSLTPIYLPEIAEDKKHGQGYMGHDNFKIIGNQFVRTFPIYNKDDANCCPTGGKRTVAYNLVAGEAGWLLKIATSSTTKGNK